MIGVLTYLLFAFWFWGVGVMPAKGQGRELVVDLEGREYFSVDASMPGVRETECFVGQSGAEKGGEWSITQWKNEPDFSLCRGQPGSRCSGADINKETPSLRFCYWKDTKKLQFFNDLTALPDKGCNANGLPGYSASPGGYNYYLSWHAMDRSDFWQNPYFRLSNLKHLYMEMGMSTDHFSQVGDCPGGGGGSGGGTY